ncbi:hypothetical protein JHK86_001200 [Glycine max]|nr:hypothetical protein JHK86_001200 [Glycine max]
MRCGRCSHGELRVQAAQDSRQDRLHGKPSGRASSAPPSLTAPKFGSDRGRKHLNPIPITWHPLLQGWIKVNYNGATRDSPDSFLGGFSSHRGVRHFFHAKLNGAMLAINITFQRGWTHLWLEIDSQLVLKAFSNSCFWNTKRGRESSHNKEDSLSELCSPCKRGHSEEDTW